MTTSDDIKIKLKNITKKWFYLKEEIPDIIDGQLNAVYSYIYNNYQSKNVGYSDRNKNIVTDNNGNITTEDKPTIPSNISDLTNDSGFITSQDISGKADSNDFDTLTATVNYTDNTSEIVTFYIVPNNSS